jgi:colanic acid/amylovoran biosynthesis protein
MTEELPLDQRLRRIGWKDRLSAAAPGLQQVLGRVVCTEPDRIRRGRMKLKVGFLGIQCDTANMGLAALTYSGVKITRDAIPGDTEFVLFSVNSEHELNRMQQSLGIAGTQLRALPFRHKDPRALLRSAREMGTCDVIIDFTGGDSFSDIYGLRRLMKKLFHKQMALVSQTSLVLAPQTYGPLKHRITAPWFTHVINRAALVFTRDEMSAQFLRDRTSREVHLATDVAVTLSWDHDRYHLPPIDRERMAVNVSGLLWNGGYTRRNQFNLVSDYREYCARVVRSLINIGHEVHLVPHVLAREWESGEEDDVRACQELQASYPECQMAPAFKNPVEAKSYIAKMDAFIGSRMHATIAAFTAGVPTVPVAYSRKFAGFFGSLGYPVVVDLTTSGTSDAVAATLGHLSDLVSLRTQTISANKIASRRIRIFTDRLADLLATS